MGEPIIKREINLNTVVILVGFATTLIGVGASWSSLTTEQTNFGKFAEEQKQVNSRVDQRLDTHDETLQQLPRMSDQLARLESTDKDTSARVDRVVENSVSQAAEFRSVLSDLKTQLALVQQSLGRIEAWRDRDRAERPNSTVTR